MDWMDTHVEGGVLTVMLHPQVYPLKDNNLAIDDLYGGRLNGRGILVP